MEDLSYLAIDQLICQPMIPIHRDEALEEAEALMRDSTFQPKPRMTDKIGIKCPQCGAFIPIDINTLVKSDYIVCEGCGIRLDFNHKSQAAIEALKKVEEAQKRVEEESKR